jgi:hypothetical protein
MIKSWNHDNVAQAMKDSLWATQEKNQALLTEAYHTSRHVILLFSVNRSMAFQGCVSLHFSRFVLNAQTQPADAPSTTGSHDIPARPISPYSFVL